MNRHFPSSVLRRLKWAAIVVIAVIIATFLLQKYLDGEKCRSKLRVLYSHIKHYQVEHGQSSYPPDIVALVTYRHPLPWDHSQTNYKLTSLLICPTHRGRWLADETVTISNVSTESEYVYINWAPFFRTNPVPPNYPLVYDRRTDNHWGLGVNVLVTPGRAFWDFRARWLRDFAKRHPEYKLPLPD